MAQIIKKLPALVLALMVTAALALAVGLTTAQTVYADDIQLDKISFNGTTSDEWWAYGYPLDTKDSKLSQEEMNITVLDAEGNQVPESAYSLKLYYTWWDNEAGKDMEKEAGYPLGLSIESADYEAGYNEMIASVEPVEGVSAGSLEKHFILYYKNTLSYAFSTVSFPGVEPNRWRMLEYCIVPKDKMADPQVMLVNPADPSEEGRILTKDQDYVVKYYQRTNDATDDMDSITTGGKELSEMPTKTGKYYAEIIATGTSYEGKKTVAFDIASSANPKYIKSLTTKKKPVTVKAKKVKKAAQTVAASKLIKLQNGIVLVQKNHFMGFKAYKKTGGDKCLTIDANTGKVKVKKGTKKGTYKIKVELRPASIYETAASSQTSVTCYIKVK